MGAYRFPLYATYPSRLHRIAKVWVFIDFVV